VITLPQRYRSAEIREEFEQAMNVKQTSLEQHKFVPL